jgi:rhodanese-related sulfurtransferase
LFYKLSNVVDNNILVFFNIIKAPSQMKQISPLELNNLISDNKAIIIDVREPFEHFSCKIQNSILIPSSSFDEAKIPAPTEGKSIVFHCKSGRRSAMVLNKVKNKNYLNLDGGIDAWKNANLAVEQSEKKHLPLDRQVQLTIGLILILSFLCSYFIGVKFIFISLFIGLGLTFAALTGICGLAMIIAKAPWNKVYQHQNITSCHIK